MLLRLLFVLSLAAALALTDDGPFIDPNGGAAFATDQGSGIDPNGASIDRGLGMDPNG